MKLAIVVSAALLAFGAEAAKAACDSKTQIKNTGNDSGVLARELAGYTACASRLQDKWQEEHHALSGSVGELWDYKLGNGNPIDPRKKVGTWRTEGTGGTTKVTYSYDTAGPYRYAVHKIAADTYELCDGTTLNVTVKLVATGANGTQCPPTP